MCTSIDVKDVFLRFSILDMFIAFLIFSLFFFKKRSSKFKNSTKNVEKHFQSH